MQTVSQGSRAIHGLPRKLVCIGPEQSLGVYMTKWSFQTQLKKEKKGPHLSDRRHPTADTCSTAEGRR